MSSTLQLGPSSDFVPDLEIKLTATESDVPILPGAPTRVWTYRAELLKGNPTSVQTLVDSYVGPIIRAQTGQKVRVFFQNDLPDQPSIVHWHGLRLPEDMDGHPRYAIQPGQTYVYEFTVNDRAGTYWFHPHPDMQTGRQVYNGLAGLFLMSETRKPQHSCHRKRRISRWLSRTARSTTITSSSTPPAVPWTDRWST